MEQMREKAAKAAEWYGDTPGGGPEGVACWYCAFFRRERRRDVCEKARTPRNISPYTPACSLFAEDHL